uniref:uridine-cytidine kinase-like 1 isoform X3 n=1 Tax=Halichoerus grypus TaxID=9711 RepID=UPI00165920D7|nr:uridine-cytidine kinase-like 1 isoform X3 [Halichoerus grypus]
MAAPPASADAPRLPPPPAAAGDGPHRPAERSETACEDRSHAESLDRLLPPVGTGRSPRKRTTSQCKSEPPLLRTSKRTIYTAGRPPWYNEHGTQSKEAFAIGLGGGSASGKTTVARMIIEALDVPWVVLLSMDSFYKCLPPQVLTTQQQEQAAHNNFNFDHPDAFDFDLIVSTLKKLKQGKSVKVPVYDFTTHSRKKDWKTLYGANVIIFEGIMAFADKTLLELLDMKIFVDTDSDIRLVRRLRRDISERGRDIEGVIKQYNKFVKPAFDQYIQPTMRVADIVVPWGSGNTVAIDLIVQHMHSQLEERELSVRGSCAGICEDRVRAGCGAAVGLPCITWREGSGRDLVLKFSCSPERHVLGLRTSCPSWGLRFLCPPAAWSPFAFSVQAQEGIWAGRGGSHHSPSLSHLMVSCSAQPSPDGSIRGLGPSLQISHREAAAPTCTAHCPHHMRPHTVSGVGGWGSGRRHPFLSPQMVCVPRAALASAHQCHPLPRTLSVLKSTPQVRGMHTIIRDKETSRDEFIFYSKRLMRLLIEHALSFLPFQDCVVQTPQGQDYAGKCYAGKQITGVSILRAGETMEPALRAVCKDVRIGTILIQTNQLTGEPELHYLRLPKDISDDHVILMDCTVSTGAAAMMAVRVLLDHDVPEDKIFLLSLLMAEMGVHSVAYAFPRVRIITTAVDKRVNDLFRIIPGIGNFGDRYFGTDAAPDGSDEEEVASTS